MNAPLSFPSRTPRGPDAVASRASIKVSLFGVALLPGEDAAGFDALRAALVADLRPASTLEALQVECLAGVAWRLARVERWERYEQVKAAVSEERVWVVPDAAGGWTHTPSEIERWAAGGSIAIATAVAREAAALRTELLAEQRAVLAALTKARALCG